MRSLSCWLMTLIPQPCYPQDLLAEVGSSSRISISYAGTFIVFCCNSSHELQNLQSPIMFFHCRRIEVYEGDMILLTYVFYLKFQHLLYSNIGKYGSWNGLEGNKLVCILCGRLYFARK